MVKVAGVIVLLFALSGCNPGMYDMLHRTMDDPKIVSPNVESFVESNSIFVNWEYDEGADEYILERAQDSLVLSFSTVYRGTGTAYADRGLEGETRYIYRMFKRRGSEIFGPSPEVIGVSSMVSRDVYRNDTMETAERLETIGYIANIYYYRTYNGLEIMDEDWYYIEIPALRKASIVVNDSKVAEQNRPTHFECYEYAREAFPVVHLLDFWIINNEMETKRYYFKLYPAKLQFVGVGVPAGGDIVRYTISIGSIVPI